MLSTLSLLLPAPVHSNLSRLRQSAVPDYAAQEWPDSRPASSSSAATSSSSIPDTPRQKGYSGASTPVCEAALVRGVTESLETGMGSSGINWDSVRRGLTKISIAAEETNLPPPTHNPAFEREEYISGLTHLLSALPPLTPPELSALQSPLPALQTLPEPPTPRGTYLRRIVKSFVVSLLLLAALLLPHALALVKAAARAERRLGIGKGVVGVAREAGRRAGKVRGSGVIEGLEWMGGSVVGGLVEGVEEGVEMLRRRNEPV